MAIASPFIRETCIDQTKTTDTQRSLRLDPRGNLSGDIDTFDYVETYPVRQFGSLTNAWQTLRNFKNYNTPRKISKDDEFRS